MTGFDILKARKAANVSQSKLAKALKLRGGRGTLTDIECGLVEVTPNWAQQVIATVQQTGHTVRDSTQMVEVCTPQL